MKLKEEDKYKAVLTTEHVICKGSPVTYVVYDEDGDWQLFGDEEFDEDENPYVVSVEEILEMEPVLRKLPDMQPGQTAIRDAGSFRWTVIEEEN